MSKGLKSLNKLDDLVTDLIYEVSDPYKMPKDYGQRELFEAIEKELVAFNIIKTKKVDVKLVLWAGNNVEAYNVHVREQKDYWPREELTQEEFDLIREECHK